MSDKVDLPVSLFPMDRKLSKHTSSFRRAFEEVIDSYSLILGDKVANFESSFSKYIGVKNAVGVANGTDALELAILALKFEPNTLIGTVANAGNYASTAIKSAGMIPIYMDIEIESQLINIANVINAINLGAKAIVLTHLYGAITPDISKIVEYCEEFGVKIIEDCAQAHGSEYKGCKAGSFGHISSFSFYPTKNLGALGDGGLVACNDQGTYELLIKLRSYGWSTKYIVDVQHGRNSRLDELQAAFLLELLPHLDEENSIRSRNASYLQDKIKNKYITFLDTPIGSTWHLTVIQTPHRSELIEHLNNNGVQNGIHYPVLDCDQNGNERYIRSFGLKNSFASNSQILTIPNSPYVTSSELDYIIAVLNEFSPANI